MTFNNTNYLGKVINTNHLNLRALRIAGSELKINTDELIKVVGTATGWTDQHQILVYIPHLLHNGVYICIKNKIDTEGLVIKSIIDLNNGAKITTKARNGGGNTIIRINDLDQKVVEVV